MTRTEQILLVLAIACAAWQTALLVMAVAYASRGRSVNVGILPGLVAVALLIAIIVIR